MNHINTNWQPGKGYGDNPIRRMLMTGNFQYFVPYDVEASITINEVGIWYDETTGRYFGFFLFDPESRLYRLRRTDEVEAEY